jgi:hypothetical protein
VSTIKTRHHLSDHGGGSWDIFFFKICGASADDGGRLWTW